MPLNIEKSGEQDKEQSKEWLVNTDPEHNMLNRSFKGDPESVIRCVLSKISEHLLNRLANLDQMWLECAFGGPLSKLLTEFDSSKNS